MIKYVLAAVILSFSSVVTAETLSGRVVGIADGDTMTVLDSTNTQHKIRLAAIDAPEKAQPFGNRSKQSLSDLCFRKQAVVDVVDMDRYGRSVGVVTCDGVKANEAQISAGMAWVYRKYAEGFGYLFPLEDKARSTKLGLWADPTPLAPWEWRKAKRNQ